MNSAIILRGVSKHYSGERALMDVDLEVGAGEIFGLLGPNGAGKTTAMRIMMGIIQPSSGHAMVDGLDCQSEPIEVRRRVGYVPDPPVFQDLLTGRELLEFAAEVHGQSRTTARAEASRLLTRMGLFDAADRVVSTYSVGMRKRLALASATIHTPRVLLLDEPTSGIDPALAHQLRQALIAAAAEGVTIFLSTHQLGLAQQICSRVALLERGSIKAVGAPADLIREHAPQGSLEDVYLRLTAAAPDWGTR